jgi:type VI secretion system secreted protein VgrG
VILGAVFNEDSPSPVNHLNPRVNLFKTQQQQTFLLDDTPGEELISLSTQSGHAWLMRHGDQPGIFVKCVGGMIIKSQGKQAWHTGEHFNAWAGQTYTQQAKVGQLIRTLRGTILLKSQLDMKLHALRQIDVYAKRHAKVFCRQQSVQVKGNQMISVQQGDAQMQVQGAQKIETNKNITISSLQGDITWTNQAGTCGLVLTQTGLIRLFGDKLLLSTELQKNGATINHR